MKANQEGRAGNSVTMARESVDNGETSSKSWIDGQVEVDGRKEEEIERTEDKDK